MEQESERKRSLIEEGKREQESKRAHVTPECQKHKARSLSVKLYSNMCIYTYMYMYIHFYVYVYIYIYVCTYEYIYIHIYLHVYLYV